MPDECDLPLPARRGQKKIKKLQNWVDKSGSFPYNNFCRLTKRQPGSIAQLVRAPALQAGGHWFESSCSHHKNGPVVQLVRTLACHARGRRFEPVPGRHFAQIAQLVEQRTENPRVAGSIPALGTICGLSSSGRAPPCQGGGSEFEPRSPLQSKSGHPIWMSCFFNRPEELAVSTRARSAHKSSGGWQEFTTFRSHKEIKHNHNTPHPFLHETGGGCA